MFAAPFIAQLGRGHVDGVYALAKDPKSLDTLASASGDGVLKVWNLPSRQEVWQTQAHENLVKGLCWTQDRKLLSCGTSKGQGTIQNHVRLLYTFAVETRQRYPTSILP